MSATVVRLLPGKDKRFLGGHPWIYSNEVAMTAETKAIVPGSMVRLLRVDGKPLAVGSFNPHALIAFRAFSTDPEADIGLALLTARIERARALRDRIVGVPHYRLIHAEADGLPGVVIDRLGDTAVVQANTAGADALLPILIEALDRVVAPKTVVIRGDSPARSIEGLESTVTVARGDIAEAVPLTENGLTFFADPKGGQKTGWFFDQRDNRAFVAGLADGGRVLDVYAHSGGFGIGCAARGAARATLIDRSESALALAARAAAANGAENRCDFVKGEAFAELERLAAEGQRYDVVVTDPPAFAKSRKDQPQAAKAYRKLARLGAALVAPGGFLFIASCSHNMPADAFQAEVARGIVQAGRVGRILRAAGAGPDHPIHPALPESAYLKSLTLQLD